MSDRKKSFVLHLDYQQHFDLLTDEQLGKLIRAIFAYETTGEPPELKDAVLKMCFSFVKNQLDRDREAYEMRCQANRENGARGGRPKNPTKPNKTEKTERYYQKIISLFNQICVSLPKVEKLTANRKQRIRSASKDLNGDFEGFFRKIEASDFLTGRSGSWSGCSFDWIFKPQNLIKIVEGNYNNKDQSVNTGRGYHINYTIEG